MLLKCEKIAFFELTQISRKKKHKKKQAKKSKEENKGKEEKKEELRSTKAPKKQENRFFEIILFIPQFCS